MHTPRGSVHGSAWPCTPPVLHNRQASTNTDQPQSYRPAASPPPLQVWAGLKDFVCCEVLNSVGATWTGLIACGSCCIVLLVLLFVWIGRWVSGGRREGP